MSLKLESRSELDNATGHPLLVQLFEKMAGFVADFWGPGADEVHRSPPGCSLCPNWKGWLSHFQPPSFFSELHNIRVINKTLIPYIRNWRQRELAVTGISQAMTHLLSVDQDPHKHEHWPTRRFFVSSRLFSRLPTSRQEHKNRSPWR